MKLPVHKDFFLDRRIRSGYGLAFLLLLVSYFLIFFTNKKLEEQAGWVIHSNSSITKIEQLLSSLKDAESGFRGYLIVKDDKFLDHYYENIKQLSIEMGDLRSWTIDNPVQQKKVDTLNRLVVKKLSVMKNELGNFNKTGQVITDTLKTMLHVGKQTMDDIRELIGRMKGEENKLLASRTESFNAIKSALKLINVTSLLIAFLLIAYSAITYNRENRLKKQADVQAAIYRQDLEEKVKDLKEANTELIELRRNEKFAVTGRIAGTIAHEVKNPLTNINLAAEQLKGAVIEDEETSLLFDMIKRNGNRINQLVTDLLNSTKARELKFDRVSINELLDEAFELVQDRVELTHIKVEKKYSTDICDVAVDKEQIKIALLNLIVNAVEATENGQGVLILKTESRNNKCVVIIADNGTGMKEEDLSKLFEPFFTRKPKGTGLGLTHTQNIILNHKGSINVESKQGMGTTFEITLDFA